MSPRSLDGKMNSAGFVESHLVFLVVLGVNPGLQLHDLIEANAVSRSQLPLRTKSAPPPAPCHFRPGFRAISQWPLVERSWGRQHKRIRGTSFSGVSK